MSILAIICEYNPFHNGHKYHIDSHRKKYNTDGVVCVMSGNFMQRGEPAIINKWARAEMAIAGGADLVLELPVCFCAQSAERFARGAVSLIDKLGVVDFLSFGSECGDIGTLEEIANRLISNEENGEFKSFYDEGISYPAARQKMLENTQNGALVEILKEPNNILAIEYIMALKKIGSKVLPVTLKRFGAEHDSADAFCEFASASRLRQMIRDGEDVSKFLPPESVRILKREKEDILLDDTPLSNILTYILRTAKNEDLGQILDMAEGLHNRFIDGAKQFDKISDICEFVKTKRYTQSRIRRIAINTILGITKEMDKQNCEYARVLALNKKGAEILNEVKKNSDIEIITKTTDRNLSDSGESMFKKDVLATDIFAQLAGNKKAGQDFTNSPVFVKNAEGKNEDCYNL